VYFAKLVFSDPTQSNVVEEIAVQITLGRDELKSVVTEVLVEIQGRFVSDDRLAFDEAEAARIISVKKYQLRDARLKGEITPGKIGRTWLYSRKMLIEHVEKNMTNKKPTE
jgi:hypothetical protein